MGRAKLDSGGLTPKQRAFVEAYTGNGVEAARKAGYRGIMSTLSAIATENLNKPLVKKAMEERLNRATKRRIATREELQEFWSEVTYNPDIQMRDRMKASELLGKSQAAFTEKIDARVSVQGGPTLVIWGPHEKNEPDTPPVHPAP